MGQKKVSEETLREIQELAAGWGKIVAKRVLGDAPGTGLDLQAMEQIAQAATAGLTQGTFEVLLQKEAQSLGTMQPCPACHQGCLVGHEDRDLYVKGGLINYHEPVCYCPACRRHFFPPESLSTSG